jgi:hypothetical protein
VWDQAQKMPLGVLLPVMPKDPPFIVTRQIARWGSNPHLGMFRRGDLERGFRPISWATSIRTRPDRSQMTAMSVRHLPMLVLQVWPHPRTLGMRWSDPSQHGRGVVHLHTTPVESCCKCFSLRSDGADSCYYSTAFQ